VLYATLAQASPVTASPSLLALYFFNIHGEFRINWNQEIVNRYICFCILLFFILINTNVLFAATGIYIGSVYAKSLGLFKNMRQNYGLERKAGLYLEVI